MCTLPLLCLSFFVSTFTIIVRPSPTKFLLPKCQLCFCLSISILLHSPCLSLSCSLVLSLISSAFVSSLDSVGSTHFPFFFIIRQLLYTLYLTIQPPPPPPPPQLQLQLHPSHSVFLFQPASRGRGVLIHLQARL